MKLLNKISAANPSLAMESLVGVVGTESFNLADMANRGKDFIGEVITTGVTSINYALTAFKSANLGNSVTTFFKPGPDVKYNNVMRLRVPCPEGFNGDVIEYVAVLNEQVEQALRLQTEILIPLQDFLSDLINRPGHARDTRTHLSYLRDATSTRLQLLKKSQRFFRASTNSNGLFGDLYRNMGEWDSAYKAVQALQGKADSINREEMVTRATEINRLIGLLAESNKTSELDNMSRTVISEIATGVYEAAKQVEQTGLTLFSVYVLANVMNQTAEKIGQ